MEFIQKMIFQFLGLDDSEAKTLSSCFKEFKETDPSDRASFEWPEELTVSGQIAVGALRMAYETPWIFWTGIVGFVLVPVKFLSSIL